MDFEAEVGRVWREVPALVAAVSGGPDSVALARALLASRPSANRPLVLAHLNHQLRGADSDTDEAFVVALWERLSPNGNVHLARHRLDIGALARAEGENLEAIARRERYRWLAEVARSHTIAFIGTGHTASDQAETVLHRLLRGTGLDGLRGIATRRVLQEGITLVRPMLRLTRQQVVDYLQAIGQEARHDASNDDRRLMRNRLRHDLLPLLQRDYNPRIEAVLGRLAEQAEEVQRDEEEQARSALHQAELPRAGSMIVLDVAILRARSPRCVRAAMRLIWRREGWPMDAMGHRWWNELETLARAENGAHDLPGGVRATRWGGVLRLVRA